MNAEEVIQQVRRKRALDCAMLSLIQDRNLERNTMILPRREEANCCARKSRQQPFEKSTRQSAGECKSTPPPVERETSFTANDDVLIEIAPGVPSRLRGAKETCEYIRQDRYTVLACFVCSSQICCIDDADFVLCPGCRVIIPIDQSCPRETAQSDRGIGLGLTVDELQSLQSQILQEQGCGIYFNA